MGKAAAFECLRFRAQTTVELLLRTDSPPPSHPRLSLSLSVSVVRIQPRITIFAKKPASGQYEGLNL